MAPEPKSVLITGCSPGGVGNALALMFHSKGFRVFATARSLTKIQSLATKGIEVLKLDVSRSESIAIAQGEVKRKTGGKLDFLINNAGQWLESPAIDTEISVIKSMYDVNVFGPMEMVRQFIPLLLPAQGTIVNIGSILGVMPYPLTAAYNGSKAALAQYSETLRLELEPLNINVVTVVTGQVSSNLPTLPQLDENSIYKPLEPALAARTKAHQEAMSPEIYAAALVTHVTGHSPSPWFWKGTNVTVTWIISTFAPKRAFDTLMKRLSGLGNARDDILQRALEVWSKCD